MTHLLIRPYKLLELGTHSIKELFGDVSDHLLGIRHYRASIERRSTSGTAAGVLLPGTRSTSSDYRSVRCHSFAGVTSVMESASSFLIEQVESSSSRIERILFHFSSTVTYEKKAVAKMNGTDSKREERKFV